MNAIDNLIFTTLNDTFGGEPIKSDFKTKIPPLSIDNSKFSYTYDDRHNFMSIDDSAIIEKAIQKHWFDISRKEIYSKTVEFDQFIYSNFTFSPPYHLIYAFLIENSRIIQIFEKLLQLYLNDEILPIGSNKEVVNWIYNTENLFFKELPNGAYRSISSQVRVYSEASRRNAYKRLFGMDLSFGDFRNKDQAYPYYNAQVKNNSFVALFEQFLKEVWQSYINARNTSGMNTTDYQSLYDLSWNIQQLLMSRRSGNDPFIDSNNYPYYNLSREEFSSVIMAEWFFHIISYPSKIVSHLGCEATTAGERLIRIGDKVGLKAHKKSQSLFDLANPIAYILREIEKSTFTEDYLRRTIESQSNPGNADLKQKKELFDLLSIINNWEVTTGHIIKTQTTPVRISR